MGVQIVCAQAQLKCSCSPGGQSVLSVTSNQKVKSNGQLVATLMDNTLANIPSFGMCTSESNPAVAEATADADGVPTPGACMPQLSGPWDSPSQKVKIQGNAALLKGSTAQCAYGGSITITDPGQQKVTAS